ncbi:MAG: hypothetical protein ACI8T1_000093 [Verrucomicrobiales bacterium]|jgi:hypothetical protein
MVKFLLKAAIFAACVYAFLVWQNQTYTGVGVDREDVKRAGLPRDAEDISYWHDGTNYIAEYTISELALKNRYSDFRFTEIAKPIECPRYTYGDINRFPFESPHRADPASVVNGIEYQIVWDNGSGYDIVFDRDSKRVFIWMAAH